MQFSSLRIVQKISLTIVLFSLGIALFMTIVTSREIAKNAQDTATQFLISVSSNMFRDLKQNYYDFQRIKSDLNDEQGQRAEEFWKKVVDNTLTYIPEKLAAVILDTEGNVVAPAHLKNIIAPTLRQKIAVFTEFNKPITLETKMGLVTCVGYAFEGDEYYLAVYFLHQNMQDILWERYKVVIICTIIIIIMGMFIAWLLSRHFSKPLQSLNEVATKLPTLDISSEHIWDKLPKLPLERKDEIGTLANSFEYMVETIQKNVAETLRLSAVQEKANAELRLAYSIQQSILPKEFVPNFATQKMNPHVHGVVLPAREVGGDLFDVFWLDDEYFCFAIGDVSDKGVPAALFMSITLTLIRSIMQHDDYKHDPAKVLEYINNTLCQNNSNNMFVTLVVGVLHCGSGEVVFSNAGHSPPICIDANGALKVLPTHKEMVVGSFDDIIYTNIKYELQTGERMFLYTDGVNEAINTQGARLGDAALHEFLYRGAGLDPKQLNEYVIKQIQEFSVSTPQYDDITLLNFLWTKP